MSESSDNGAGARRYAVVGGGMSGIAAAFFLQRQGHAVTLYERQSHLGGRCQTARLGARTVTLGGKNIGRRYASFRAFTAALCENPYEYFGINSARVEHGHLRTFDSTRRLRSVLELRRRATAADAARFLTICARVKAREENGFLSPAEFAPRHSATTLSDYFSNRFAAGILRPITVRMNGAEPDEITVGTFGTNVAMLLDSYDQLSLGMQRVLDAFALSHHVTTDADVESLVVRGGRVCGVCVKTRGEREVHECDGVIVATPAAAAADLVAEHDACLAGALRTVRYFPAAVAIAEYEEPIFTREIRALVFPASEPLSNAGAYSVDDRHVVRYTFSGRSARAQLREQSPEGLLERAERLLGAHFPVGRRRDFVFRRWDVAYCAYHPRHAAFLERMRGGLALLPGLYLAGDYVRGASIEACFRSGRDAATEAARAPLRRAQAQGVVHHDLA